MLRPYQKTAVKQILETPNPLYQLVTGGGKTKIAIEIIKQLPSAWFVVHRKELIDQTASRFREAGIDFSFIAADYDYNPDKQVQLVMIQTLYTRGIDNFIKPNKVIIDESHRCLSNQYEALKSLPRIGLSATPYRLSGAGFTDYYDKLITGPSMQELIDNGYLAPYDIYCPPTTFDRSQLHIRGGEFKAEEIKKQLEDAQIIGDAIKHYNQYLNGKQAIAFCASIAHSEATAKEFNDAGIPSAHLDANTLKQQRTDIINLFRQGDIKLLCNCDIIAEGFDVPACDGVLMLRPTKSLSLYLQQAGRALRPATNKRAIILDFVRNTIEHDQPAAPHNWHEHFKGRDKRKLDGIVTVTTCPSCFVVHAASVTTCPSCGYKYKQQDIGNRNVTYKINKDVDLVRFDPKQVKQKKKNGLFKEHIHSCNSATDCVALAKQIGNKPGAGYFYWKILQAVRKQKPTQLWQYKQIMKQLGAYDAMAYLFYGAQ